MNNLPEIRGKYEKNKLLAPMTTLKIGGTADVWATFEDWDDLAFFLKHKSVNIPLTLVGEGSNLAIRDGGISGVCTHLSKGFDTVTVTKDEIYAEAGATCGKIARIAREKALTGLEFFCGIPGSIGGALKMNAGAYGYETKDMLKHVVVLTNEGVEKTLLPKELNYSYRCSDLPHGWIFKAAVFLLKKGDKNKIRAEMRRINTERRTTQPLSMPSSGSWFKNPTINGVKLNAWKVLDEAGCRGLQVGQAQVSELHCNFFVNLGGATAKDFEKLSDKVQKIVEDKLGITLEQEVKMVGYDS